MKLTNSISIKLENFDKCQMLCDNDCPLGQLYDFSCALQSFIVQRIKDAEAAKVEVKEEEIPA